MAYHSETRIQWCFLGYLGSFSDIVRVGVFGNFGFEAARKTAVYTPAVGDNTGHVEFETLALNFADLNSAIWHVFGRVWISENDIFLGDVIKREGGIKTVV